MSRLSPEQEAFQSRVRSLAARGLAPLAERIEATSAFPQAAYDLFAAEQLFAVALPKSHGGPEADALSLALMVEAIASVSPSSSLLVFPTNAVLRTIALTGTAEQKERLFAELKAGVHPMGFCLTEPDHGSDAANIQAKAQRRGDLYIVSGTKSYVTLGPHARYYLTFVRTGPGPRAEGLSALLIPRDAPGVSFGPPEKKLGLHGSVTSQMFLDQAQVPAANRLAGEGEGWRVLREVANPMRAWGAAALALGAAQGLYALALAHARATGCGRQQAVGFALAEMKMQIEACRSLVHRVCGLVDEFTAAPDPANFLELECMVSLSKCFAADTGVRVANLAGQVLGRAMAVGGSLAASLFCVTKGVQIFDGSNQVQRLVVARNLMEA
ncbi:MAG: acyl-CoA dehydrogenase family protein [Pseudomonadota bacterium]